MTFLPFILIICASYPASAIIGGQRISILKVPFMAFLESKSIYDHEARIYKFSGAIVNEKMVVTTLFHNPKQFRTVVTVGVSSLETAAMHYPVTRTENNGRVAVMSIHRLRFTYGVGVQLASIRFSGKPAPDGWLLHLVACGLMENRTTAVQPDVLHSANVVISYGMSDARDREFFGIRDDEHAKTVTAASDVGGALICLDTGQIVGMVSKPQKGDDGVMFAVNMGHQRRFIDDAIDMIRLDYERPSSEL